MFTSRKDTNTVPGIRFVVAGFYWLLVWGFYLWFHVCVCLVFVCFFHTHIPLRNTVQYKLMGEICYCNFIFIVLKYWPSASLSMHSATKKETY